MKIISLTAENVKRIKAITITPNGDIVEVVGKNGQGKSSVLDSIWWALAGTKHIQAMPIRNGEKKARIRLDLGEIVVERKFTASGTTLTVEADNGARFPHPQAMLDGLIGSLSFDPLAFSRLKPKEQREALRGLLTGLGELDTIDPAIRSAYEQRTDINRQAKSALAAVASISVDDAEDPGEDEANVLAQMEEAAKSNQAAANEANALRRALDAAEQADRELHVLLEQKSALQDQIAKLDKALKDRTPAVIAALKSAREATPTLVVQDMSAFRPRIEKARAFAKAATQKASRDELKKKASALEKTSEDLTAKIAELEEKKRNLIEGAEMPIPHLGLGDEGVTYKTIPLDQCSSAEQLRVSVALAMAANPKLRVLRIQDGSLLDADSMANIEEMASAGDYQIWIERVESSGRVGVVIEDGEVKIVKDAA